MTNKFFSKKGFTNVYSIGTCSSLLTDLFGHNVAHIFRNPVAPGPDNRTALASLDRIRLILALLLVLERTALSGDNVTLNQKASSFYKKLGHFVVVYRKNISSEKRPSFDRLRSSVHSLETT